MDERIKLARPELVAMRPEEYREAVGLLAALIRPAGSSLPASGARSGRRRSSKQAVGMPGSNPRTAGRP